MHNFYRFLLALQQKIKKDISIHTISIISLVLLFKSSWQVKLQILVFIIVVVVIVVVVLFGFDLLWLLFLVDSLGSGQEDCVMVELGLLFVDSLLNECKLTVDLVDWEGLGGFERFAGLFEAIFDGWNLLSESFLLSLDPFFQSHKLFLQNLWRGFLQSFSDSGVDCA